MLVFGKTSVRILIKYDFFSRSSDSSTPRSGTQGNRASGSTGANSNSPTTPATTTAASNVRFRFFSIDFIIFTYKNYILICRLRKHRRKLQPDRVEETARKMNLVEAQLLVHIQHHFDLDREI